MERSPPHPPPPIPDHVLLMQSQMSGYGSALLFPQTWVPILSLLLTQYVSLSKLPNGSVPCL